MNKSPVFGRSVLVLAILVIFGLSIYPLFPRNVYDTFKGMVSSAKDKDGKVEKVIALAQEKQAKDKDLYPSIALEQAADELNVFLPEYVKTPDLTSNRDVLRVARQNAAASIKLGLDLAGGTEFMVSVVPEKRVVTDSGVAQGDADESESVLRDKVIEIMRNRINRSGLKEPEIAPMGTSGVSIKVPVATEAEKAELRKLVQMSAKLQFRLIPENNQALVEQFNANPEQFIPPVGLERMRIERVGKNGQPVAPEVVFVEIHPQMDGQNITRAVVTRDEFGQRRIVLRFNTAGAIDFGEVTSKNVGRRLAIVLDGTCYSAPTIQGAITGGSAEITGSFTAEEAERISTALGCGNLPAKIKIDAVFDTDPTLGKESVESGSIAFLIGAVLVVLFMIAVYQIAGVVACLALAANVILVLGALASFGATLTLPGIAGIILTIGMAVDANVLIFERIREELAAHKTLWNAIDLGYKRAFITILDANLTTLIVAIILYWQGTGAIRGFAVTLSIGILASMFTAIYLTRLVFDIIGRFVNLRKLWVGWGVSERNINFLGMWKGAAIVSISLIVITFLVAGIRGRDIFSVDFTGGSQMILSYEEYKPLGAITQALDKAGYDAKVTYKSSATEGRKLEVVLSGAKSEDENAPESPMTRVVNLLNKNFPDAKFKGGRESSLGALIGSRFAWSAIVAIILSFIGLVIYISLRFEFAFAIAAIVALLHDVIIATGILLIFGRQLSLPVIAALLTIVGYSVNDTIVVFDRVRENIQQHVKKNYKEIINISINQTLTRTVLTSVTTLIAVLSLLIFGGVSLNSFALIMTAGIIVGTYSSIFVASPVVAMWHKSVIGVKEDD